MEEIKFILYQAFQLEYHRIPRIQFYHYPAFEKPYLIQFLLYKDQWDITKSILDDQVIHIMTGSYTGHLIGKTYKQLDQININDFGLHENLREGRDGHNAELTLSRGMSNAVFSWAEVSMPSQWEGCLLPFIHIFTALDSAIDWKHKTSLSYQYIQENNASSIVEQFDKSYLLSFKTISSI